ncbi:hypothetical protein M8J76_006965 [Diaphorina citri]|nr:hypothetical protein M8J76_006965 [Diaphorina citri]
MSSLVDHCKTCPQMARPDAFRYKFVCYGCPSYYTYALGNMKRHVGEIGIGKLQCTFCDLGLSRNINEILDHKCTEDLHQFQCCICNNVFKCKWLLKRHLFKHTGDKLYSCHYCDYRSAYTCDIKKHTRNHTGERPYKCEFCAYAGKTAWHLKLHVGHLAKLNCGMCGKLFKNIISFNRHTKFSCDHAATEPFACEACGKAYKNKGSLNRHLKSPFGLSDFADTSSEYGYSYPELMKRQFKFTCFDCGKSYKNRNLRDRHRKTECGRADRGNGPIIRCPLCAYESAEMTDFRTHFIMKHNALTPARSSVRDPDDETEYALGL